MSDAYFTDYRPALYKGGNRGNHFLAQPQDMTLKQKHPLPWEATEREKKSVVFIIQQIHKFRSRKSSGWAKVTTTNKQSCASTSDQKTCPKITNQKPWACLPGPWKQLQKTKGRTVLLTSSLLLDTEQLQVSIIPAVADWIKGKQMSHVGSLYRGGPQVGAGPL